MVTTASVDYELAEQPALPRGLLTIAADRRVLSGAMANINSHELGAAIGDELLRRYGAILADVILSDARRRVK